MPSILNATTSSGLVTSADNSGSLQLATNNGTTAVTITTAQNVGIGTSSPQARLHQSSTNDGVQAIFTGAQTGTTQTILFRSQYQTNNGTAGFANIGWFDNGSQGGGLTFGTTSNGGGTTGIPTERGRFDSSGNFLFNSGYGSVATAYGCRAWVNFNGIGTVAIRASGNVSSITDNAVGAYQINFTTALPNANYSVVGTCGAGDGSSNLGVGINDINVAPPATSVVYINTRRRDTNADTDSAYVCVSVFR